MTDRELMQMALDALENVRLYDLEDLYGLDYEVKALRDRLAQPKQEPAAWLDSDGFPWTEEGIKCRTIEDTYEPLYTAPLKREWVGLTDADKSWAFDETQEGGGFWEFADAIEAKLKEKNT